MKLANTCIGFAVTGSFCTFDNTLGALQELVKAGARVVPIFSFHTQTMDTRFGEAEAFHKAVESITGETTIQTIQDAEPIGPGAFLDILILAPCTGNTLAKFCNGITDTPALMAAKAHMRNGKPLVIALSTNDALGMNFKNIGLLLNMKNIYFVPFGQDNPTAKPNSMIAHNDLIVPTLELALEGKQLQPVIRSPF